MKLEKSLELLRKLGDGREYDKEYDYLFVETSLSQKDATEVVDILSPSEVDFINSKIKEMRENGLYSRKTSCHGKRHVEDVMLFAMLISKMEKLQEEDRKLLIESAMYHDEGRVNDLDEQHGTNSAYIAGEKLKEKYSESDIKIIQAAIIFHDDRTAGNSIKEIENKGFDNIAKTLMLDEEEKIRARRIGNILKDADALDRTRFAWHVYAIDERYLRTTSSKTLIKIAYELNEAYALEDLDELLKDQDESIISNMENYKNQTSPIRAKTKFLQKSRNKK